MLNTLRFVVLLTLFCCGSVLHAQVANGIAPGNQNRPKYTISGTVVNSVTGQPIRRVLVQVPGQAPQAVFTDETGRFQFNNVPEGSFWLQAQKPGFFPEAPSRATHLSSDIKDLQLKMIPEARIEGRRSDAEGEPLEGIQVQVLAEDVANGRKLMDGAGLRHPMGQAIIKLAT